MRRDAERNDNYTQRKACERCGRKHLGGAKACIATRHADGRQLDTGKGGNRKKQGGEGSNLKRCWNCNSTTHTKATCPRPIKRIGTESTGAKQQRTLKVKFSKKRPRSVYEHEASSDHSSSDGDDSSQSSEPEVDY
jgi:hypothetical protein